MSAAGLKTFEQLYQAPNFNLQPAQNAANTSTATQNVDNKGLENGDTVTFAGKEINKKKLIIGAVGLGALAVLTFLGISKGKKAPAAREILSDEGIEAINAGVRIKAGNDFVIRVENVLRNIEETKDRALDMYKRAEKYVKRYADADLSDIAPDEQGRKILTLVKKKHTIMGTFIPSDSKYTLEQIQISKPDKGVQNTIFTTTIQDGKITSCRLQNNCDMEPEFRKTKFKELQIKKNGYIYNENGTVLEVVNDLPKTFYRNARDTKSEYFFPAESGKRIKLTRKKAGPVVEFDNEGRITGFADDIKKIHVDLISKDGLSTAHEEHVHTKYFLKANEAGELIKIDEEELAEFVHKVL